MDSEVVRKSVMTGLRWSAASRAAVQGISWAITLMVVRLLTPHDYGLATQVGIVTGYITLLGELGLSVGLVQQRITEEQKLRKVFALLLVMGVFAYLAL